MLNVAHIQSFTDLYSFYHHVCHRSEPKFREALQDLGLQDRITLCVQVGWRYIDEKWPIIMEDLHWKVNHKSLDDERPPERERGKLTPELFLTDDECKNLYPPMDDDTYQRTKLSVTINGLYRERVRVRMRHGKELAQCCANFAETIKGGNHGD